MTTASKPAPSAGTSLEQDLSALEQRQATLIAHTRALRAANESLRHELAAANARNKLSVERAAEATRRLDALLAQLPEAAE